MAILLTEIFVSIDGLNFTKLDLHKDENIPLRYTAKDLSNISKIFTPYSRSFTFPATPKNRNAFGFFGDTDVEKINEDLFFTTKIYTDGNLYLQGLLQVTDLKYKNGKPTDFTGKFATSMTNLKDRIGDDLITELTDESIEVDWLPNNVFDLLQGADNQTVDGVNVSYFVPLISSTRVLAFDSNIASPLKDNVAYDELVDANGTGTIKSSELRPCVSFSTIIDLIRKKYNLTVICPLDFRKEYTELMVWCNSEDLFNPNDSLLTIYTDFGALFWYDTKNESGIADPKKYVATLNTTDNSFKVIKQAVAQPDEYTDFFTQKIRFDGVIITGSSDSPTVNIKIVRKGTTDVLISKQFDIEDGAFNCDVQIGDGLMLLDEIEYEIYAQFNQATTWTNCYFEVFFKYYDGKTGWFNSKEYATYAYASSPNNNVSDVGGTKIDLFKSLPKMKVTDFLTSYFKMFNISVFDTSPTNEDLFWLTPDDIQTRGLVYSKATLDYTPYVDIKSITKSTPGDYNVYDFKHAESEFRSNVDYKNAIGLDYGQAKLPLVIPSNPKSFKIETKFTLMIPVLLVGSDIITYYGFNADAPEITDTGESRYEPNYDELAIFYNQGNKSMLQVLGYQKTLNGNVINSPLNNYMQVLPWNSDNNSLAFSVLKEMDIEYPLSLYDSYYKNQTERLLDPNVLTQKFSVTLPPSEIYMNEATTIQGGGDTPVGFRLQNDIIIGENLFSILDAEINITDGKTKLKLLNFTTQIIEPTPPPPIPELKPPIDLIATNITSTSFTLSWSTPLDSLPISGYNIYKDGVFYADAGLVLTLDISGLTAGDEFEWMIRSYDSIAAESTDSVSINVRLLQTIEIRMSGAVSTSCGTETHVSRWFNPGGITHPLPQIGENIYIDANQINNFNGGNDTWIIQATDGSLDKIKAFITTSGMVQVVTPCP